MTATIPCSLETQSIGKVIIHSKLSHGTVGLLKICKKTHGSEYNQPKTQGIKVQNCRECLRRHPAHL